MDEQLLLFINHGWSHPWLDNFFIWVSAKASFSFPLMFIVLGIFIYKAGKPGAKLWGIMVLTIGLGDFTGAQIKSITDMPRPCTSLHEIVVQPQNPSGGPCTNNLVGMPSNHTLNFFVAFSFLTLVLRSWRWGLSFFLIACTVGISRIYLSKHFPSQVLSGAILGTLIGSLSAWLTIKYGRSTLETRDKILRRKI